MKKFFKKIARYVVAAYANRLYKKAVKRADERHEKERIMVYVISSFFDDKHLVCCNRKEFRMMKAKLRLRHHIQTLKEGCWYHTADAIERNGLDPRDQEARKRVFVRMLIKKAGLE
jgi:hypothetical protein